MTAKEITLRKLQTFKRRKHDLNFFIEVDIQAFQEYINGCIDELYAGVEKDYPPQLLKNIFNKYLPSIRRMQIVETVEREYVCSELYELSRIVDVNISFRLNQIMYGTLLALLPQRKPRGQKEPIYENIENTCTECGYVMRTKVNFYETEPEEEVKLGDIWEGHVIVECPVCGGYNLVYIKDKRRGFASGDYRVTENLHNDYTEEEAIQRLEQIKYWRK